MEEVRSLASGKSRINSLEIPAPQSPAADYPRVCPRFRASLRRLGKMATLPPRPPSHRRLLTSSRRSRFFSNPPKLSSREMDLSENPRPPPHLPPWLRFDPRDSWHPRASPPLTGNPAPRNRCLHLPWSRLRPHRPPPWSGAWILRPPTRPSPPRCAQNRHLFPLPNCPRHPPRAARHPDGHSAFLKKLRVGDFVVNHCNLVIHALGLAELHLGDAELKE